MGRFPLAEANAALDAAALKDSIKVGPNLKP
jgi:hypothetical protein